MYVRTSGALEIYFRDISSISQSDGGIENASQ